MLEGCIDRLIYPAQLQKNVETDSIFGAFPLYNHPVQNRCYQCRINVPGEAECPVQGLTDGRDVQFFGGPAFFLLPDCGQLSLASQDLGVKGIVALLEFLHR